MSKHTPGPLSVSFGTKWPFEILISNESGAVVYRQSLPCHSSKDMNFTEIAEFIEVAEKVEV